MSMEINTTVIVGRVSIALTARPQSKSLTDVDLFSPYAGHHPLLGGRLWHAQVKWHGQAAGGGAGP